MKMLMKNLIVKIGTFLMLCTAVLTVNAQEIRPRTGMLDRAVIR